MSSRAVRQNIPGEPKLSGVKAPKIPACGFDKKTGNDADGEKQKKD